MLFKIFVCFVVIAFACNVESFGIAILVFFFSFPFSSLFFWLRSFTNVSRFAAQEAYNQDRTYCVGQTEESVRNWCFWRCYLQLVWPMSCHVHYLMHRNQHSHPKNYEIGNLGNKKENDREGSIVQGSKDGKIHLISRKVWRKIKVAQKKRLIDT